MRTEPIFRNHPIYALAVICLGVVLYNVALSSLAAGLLILSLARRASAPE